MSISSPFFTLRDTVTPTTMPSNVDQKSKEKAQIGSLYSEARPRGYLVTRSRDRGILAAMLSNVDQNREKAQIDALCSEAKEIKTKAPRDRHQASRDLMANVQKFWISSDCRKSVKDRIEKFAPTTGWPIKRSVLVGAGHVTGSAWFDSEPLRPILQLVVFLDYVHLLGATASPLFAQDPRFTTTDKELLEACKFSILEVPQAEQIIDGSTFVMSFCSVGHEMLAAPVYDQPLILASNDRTALQSWSETRLEYVKERLRRTPLSHDLYAVRAKYMRWAEEGYKRFMETSETYHQVQTCAEVDSMFYAFNYRWKHYFKNLGNNDREKLPEGQWSPQLECLWIYMKKSPHPATGPQTRSRSVPVAAYGQGYGHSGINPWHAQMDGDVPYRR